MTGYISVFSSLIEEFVHYRNVSGMWCKSYENNLQAFDRFCAERYPGMPLSQEMVDGWCMRKETELSNSCRSRTFVVHDFVRYLRDRNLSDIVDPPLPKPEVRQYIPHAFSQEELTRFFYECDHMTFTHKNGIYAKMGRITCPVFFRLLYSSGIRTIEARYLKREDVDLTHGILNIRKTKGYHQHYVALHKTMTELLRTYDEAANKLLPDREYFFQSPRSNECYSSMWVGETFRTLWEKANGKRPKGNSRTIPYALRHHYAAVNINSWKSDTFEFTDHLHTLSKSMGHQKLKSTLYYYSIVPRLAETLQELTEAGFNEIVPDPEVAYEKE